VRWISPTPRASACAAIQEPGVDLNGEIAVRSAGDFNHRSFTPFDRAAEKPLDDACRIVKPDAGKLQFKTDCPRSPFAVVVGGRILEFHTSPVLCRIICLTVGNPVTSPDVYPPVPKSFPRGKKFEFGLEVSRLRAEPVIPLTGQITNIRPLRRLPRGINLDAAVCCCLHGRRSPLAGRGAPAG